MQRHQPEEGTRIIEDFRKYFKFPKGADEQNTGQLIILEHDQQSQSLRDLLNANALPKHPSTLEDPRRTLKT